MQKESLENEFTLREPGVEYSVEKNNLEKTYINPFRDKFFKKIFASESSKEILRSFINGVLDGRRHVQTVTYGKNEYPGEIESERNAVFDVVCTDTDGATFMVEVQQTDQLNFKDRSIFYAGRLISDQSPRGQPEWEYELKEVYVICLLIGFSLANGRSDTHMQHVTLNFKGTGEPFYDKLEFIYLELEKFKKEPHALSTILDQWLYAMKHAESLSEVPSFLHAPQLDQFFYLAKYSKLTKEERIMYRTKEQVGWDNKNTANFAGGRKEGKKEVALEMKQDGINIERIIKYTKLTREQIETL